MSEFSALISLLFGWLPADLYTPVMGIVAAGFLILIIKILIALVEIIAKVIAFFI